MTMNPPAPPTALTHSGWGRPAAWTLARWTMAVMVVHLSLLLDLADTLDWRMTAQPQLMRTGPLETRWVQPVDLSAQNSLSGPINAVKPQTRVAQVAPSAQPETPANTSSQEDVSATLPVAAPQIEASSPEVATLPDSGATPAPQNETSERSGTPTATSAPVAASVAASEPSADKTALNPSASTSPDLVATSFIHQMTLGSVPPSTRLSYRLNGQEKGLHYSATGELRWQHNGSAYEMSLAVKAFLLGTRYWRSQGQITPAGLEPTRFSDSWRSERATHFDRAENRIVFSSNAPVVPLQAGAQDQISLYPQLAAAMAGSGSRLKPGTRLQIQTVTVRDALPWLLTLEQDETLSIEGQTVQTTKWVCQPRNRFDAKVEFWVAADHHWLPVRIRITQVSGNFIDLTLNGQGPLSPLPPSNPAN